MKIPSFRNLRKFGQVVNTNFYRVKQRSWLNIFPNDNGKLLSNGYLKHIRVNKKNYLFYLKIVGAKFRMCYLAFYMLCTFLYFLYVFLIGSVVFSDLIDFIFIILLDNFI